MKLNDLSKMASSFNSTAPLPVLFIGHGSPMNAIVENEFVATWRELGKTLPRPHAILVISAHWETRGTMVTAMEKPSTIHDFGGFPRPLYEVQYPAPGSPDLALEVQKTVKKTLVGMDEQWGLDHGAWSVVGRLYPKADIPVIQMSLDQYQPPQYHYELAKELAFLRHKGVLIIGSGNMVHNLRMVAWDRLNDPEYGYDWALEANEQMKSFMLKGDHQQMINYNTRGRAFDLAIPSPEHYIPSLYALALKEENEKITLFNDKVIGGSLTMTSFKIERA